MNNDLMFSSADNEHYTPINLLFKVVDFYGGMIDLDPCCNSHEHPHTPSRAQFTAIDDGLAQQWFGQVFVNPPYGRCLGEWAEKVNNEYKNGNAEEILLLVPSRTDTKWYQSLNQHQRCNVSGRLKFHNPNNKNNAAPFPSVLFYLGKRSSRFTEVFGAIGEIIARPLPSRKDYQREYQRRRRAKINFG